MACSDQGDEEYHYTDEREPVMSVAAIYARKSTEQIVTDEEKSVSRQIELARACARKHGFEVPAEHIYVDDAISGAGGVPVPGLRRFRVRHGRGRHDPRHGRQRQLDRREDNNVAHDV